MKTNKKELLQFFLIAFAWTWGFNIPRVFENQGLIEIPSFLNGVMGNLSIFGPMVAAFWLVNKKGGIHEMKSLWKRGGERSFDKKWYLPILLLLPAIGIVTLLIMNAMNIEMVWDRTLPLFLIIPIGLLILLQAYPEEFGWRGYALDRLLAEFTPLKASIFLGVLWGLWHLPLHFIDSTTQFVIPVWEYVAQTILLTVLYTWIYLRTNRSIFAVSLLHMSGNIGGATIPFWTVSEGRWINFTLLLIVVLVVVWKNSLMSNHPVETNAD